MYKVDANQAEIVDFLYDMGASCLSLALLGNGAPDLLVGFCGVDRLWEIKRPGQKPRKNQELWHRMWKGRPVAVIWSREDAARELGVEAEG